MGPVGQLGSPWPGVRFGQHTCPPLFLSQAGGRAPRPSGDSGPFQSASRPLSRATSLAQSEADARTSSDGAKPRGSGNGMNGPVAHDSPRPSTRDGGGRAPQVCSLPCSVTYRTAMRGPPLASCNAYAYRSRVTRCTPLSWLTRPASPSPCHHGRRWSSSGRWRLSSCFPRPSPWPAWSTRPRP